MVSALALSAQHLNGTIFWQVLIQSPEVTRKKLSDPFVVSDLKEKASQVKSAGVKSYGTARERFSAQTSSTTTGKPKPPPPPPPRRTSASSSSNQRSSLFSQTSATSSGTTTDDVDKIDWANLSVEDKRAFFAWLDEFFAHYLDGHLPPSSFNTPTVPVSTRSPSRNTPAPSIPARRASSRASQNTSPDPQDEVAPTPAGRRNLPPMLSSQQGPVCPHSCKRKSLRSDMHTAKDQVFHKTTRTHRNASVTSQFVSPYSFSHSLNLISYISVGISHRSLDVVSLIHNQWLRCSRRRSVHAHAHILGH